LGSVRDSDGINCLRISSAGLISKVKLDKEFVRAASQYVYRTNTSVLEGLDEGGTGELLVHDSRRVEKSITNLFVPLRPPELPPPPPKEQTPNLRYLIVEVLLIAIYLLERKKTFICTSDLPCCLRHFWPLVLTSLLVFIRSLAAPELCQGLGTAMIIMVMMVIFDNLSAMNLATSPSQPQDQAPEILNTKNGTRDKPLAKKHGIAPDERYLGILC
jgi:hypothetical protein